MLEKQIQALQTILTDEDLQKYANDGFWNLIEAVISKDAFAGISAIKNVKDLIFHMPTILFWDKMKRYLFGTFHGYDEQIKMAEKFNQDNQKYYEFVKRQIHLINEFDEDIKIDFFANLTRAFLLTPLEENLFFKLAKIISICTLAELEYIKNFEMGCNVDNSAIVSSLYHYGLFMQIESGDDTKYTLSDYAIALKQNCLNFNDGLQSGQRLIGYTDLSPLTIVEPPKVASEEDINAMFNDVVNN